MKNTTILALIILLTSASLLASTWQAELDDDLLAVTMVDNEVDILFWSTGDQIGGKSISTGKDLWTAEIDDYEFRGPNSYSGDTYIFIDDDYLKGYDMANGKIRWSVELEDLDADDFEVDFFASPDRYIIIFDGTHFAVDTYSGNVLWSKNYNLRDFMEGERVYKTITYPNQSHYTILVDRGNGINTIDIESGSIKASQADMVPQQEAINRFGTYFSPIAFTGLTAYFGEDKTIIVDDKTGIIVNYLKGSPPESFSPLTVQSDSTALLVTDEKVVWFDKNGQMTDIDMGYEDFRIVKRIFTDKEEFLAVSFSGGIMLVDTKTGKRKWQSKGDELEDGYIHDFIGISGDNMITAHSDNSLWSGTWVRLFAYDMKTGNLSWQSPELLAARSNINIINRWLGDAYNPYSPNSWYNPGFKYSSGINSKGDIWLASSWSAQPKMADGMKGNGGNGFVTVSSIDGSLLTSDFAVMNEEENYTDASYMPLPLKYGNNVYMAGTSHFAGYDTESGKRLFLEKYADSNNDEFAPYEFYISGENMLIRSGGAQYYTYLNEPVIASWFTSPSANTSEIWSSEPNALIGISLTDGKRQWIKELEEYPESLADDYKLYKWITPGGEHIMVPDKENISYLNLATGKAVASIDISSLEIEDTEDSYAIQTFAISKKRKESTRYYGYDYDLIVTREYTYFFDDDISLMDRALARADATLIYEQFGNVWGGTATKVLGIEKTPFGLLVSGTAGRAMIDETTKSVKWKNLWDFDEDDFGYAPAFLSGTVFYELDGQAEALDLRTGKLLFSTEVDSDSQYLASNDNNYLIIYAEDEIIVEKLK